MRTALIHRCASRALLVCLLLLQVRIAAAAAEPATQLTIPSKPESATIEFLLSSAAKDFKASGVMLPIQIRHARLGYLHDDRKGSFVLCGLFREALTSNTSWTPFATVKTSDYEQWVGGTAQAFCKSSTFAGTKATFREACRSGFAIEQKSMPNPSFNRSSNGWLPCPRGAVCLSSTSRARHPSVFARLTLR